MGRLIVGGLIPLYFTMENEKRCETCKFGSEVMYGQVLCYVNYKFESKRYSCEKWQKKGEEK